MVKAFEIILEHDPELETLDEYNLECNVTLNGRHYHDCLKAVCEILMNYDKTKSGKSKSLTPEAQKVLEDLKEQAAIHFLGLQNVK